MSRKTIFQRVGLDRRGVTAVVGGKVVSDHPAIGRLRDAARFVMGPTGKPPVYILRPSVSALVANTAIYSLPGEPPSLLRTSGIVEVRRQSSERLYGSVVSLSWFNVPAIKRSGATLWMLAIHDEPTGLATSLTAVGVGSGAPKSAPVGESVSRGGASRLFREMEFPADVHAAFTGGDHPGGDAVSPALFLYTLGLLMEAEESPLRVLRDCDHAEISDVYVEPPSGAAVPCDPNPPSERGERPEGLVLMASPVTGHLKRQHHGPGNSLLKWIYVRGYSSHRWVDPRFAVELKSDNASEGRHARLDRQDSQCILCNPRHELPARL